MAAAVGLILKNCNLAQTRRKKLKQSRVSGDIILKPASAMSVRLRRNPLKRE
jgi:hypothetical protein